ncbi:adhesion regulating molecule [Rickenella mellea]|uniref:Adhesion regulating molecule n=1 Tax=Rickenella mellea TaxID=50990 RepID=A0A4Y7Q4Y3_9AGAM|nr:adhesion regulating molecule [Rickenella mellea]
MAEPLLAFKAGRAVRREGTNFLDPIPTRGAVLLTNEDGLLHLQWKNRTTNEVEEDLILFPEDASFHKVTQSAWGRTYVLKFSSSNQRQFFWMQDASPARDEEFVNNVNELLRDPDYTPVWGDASEGSQAQASTSAVPPPTTTGSIPQATPEQLAHLRALVSAMASNNEATRPTVSLRDILTPETLSPLFTSHPNLISALFPQLPPDLPTPPSAEVLQRIIASPQFQAAVGNFDQALHTGLLGGLVQGLGLPEEAGTGVEPFLRAVQEQARREGGGGDAGGDGHRDDSMETD